MERWPVWCFGIANDEALVGLQFHAVLAIRIPSKRFEFNKLIGANVNGYATLTGDEVRRLHDDYKRTQANEPKR